MLYASGSPVAWFADEISALDFQRFDAREGDSAFLAVWEAWALLVGMRIWRSSAHRAARIAVRSDSLGALLAAAKGASTGWRLNLILQELALEDAELRSRIHVATHIPGFSNEHADCLSRLYAPEPKQVPVALENVLRETPVARNRQWYLTRSSPID